MKRVNQWATTMLTSETSALEKALNTGTTVKLFNPDGTKTDGEDGFFKYIWLPVKVYDEQNEKMSEYHYYNIGLQYSEIADLYQTQYGFNYLASPLHTEQIGQSVIDSQALGRKILMIFKKNLGKYYKMLELQGYTYNPLWNVDGVEIRQSLENQGINDVITNIGSFDRGLKEENNKLTHNVSAYDSGTKEEYNDTKTGLEKDEDLPQLLYDPVTGNVTSPDSKSYDNAAERNANYSASGSTTKYEHKNAENGINDTSEGGYGKEYVIEAEDTAFKQKLVGGDKMHNEKYIRQGNIGVTKTQELIESERENLRFSIIQEFFDDINAQLLVGIY